MENKTITEEEYKKRIISELEVLPNDIKETRQKIIEKTIEKDNYENSVKVIEEQTTRDVIFLVDTNGKNTFTNETQRKNEISLRLKNDEKYNQLLQKVKSVNIEIAKLDSYYEFFNNRLKVLPAILDTIKHW
jgi:hypothetical protein